ncbi:hypothetical protein LXL04_020268 [Taraxacum kok-saghyz]
MPYRPPSRCYSEGTRRNRNRERRGSRIAEECGLYTPVVVVSFSQTHPWSSNPTSISSIRGEAYHQCMEEGGRVLVPVTVEEAVTAFPATESCRREDVRVFSGSFGFGLPWRLPPPAAATSPTL